MGEIRIEDEEKLNHRWTEGELLMADLISVKVANERHEFLAIQFPGCAAG